MNHHFRIESLLAARQFLAPQLVGDWLYFVSDMAGRLNLYRMRLGGSIPQPLLPPHIALQNPHLIGGEGVYRVLPGLDKILLMLDRDGDENYQPMLIPLDGGIPEALFGDRFAGQQVNCGWIDVKQNCAIFTSDPRTAPNYRTFFVDLATLAVTELGSSPYGNAPTAVNADRTRVILADFYTVPTPGT